MRFWAAIRIELRPAQTKKKVVVVGAGPAGMEAARVAAMRGHEVILYEKEKQLGGLLRWVALIKGLDADSDATILIDYLKNRITKLGVQITLGEEFKPLLLPIINPDAVLLATGSIPTFPKIPGLDRSNVIGVDELYCRMKDDLELVEPSILRWVSRYWDFIGKNVVVIGGTIQGCGMAGFLAERCGNATLVDQGRILGGEPLMRFPSMKKVATMPEIRYREITSKGLDITTKKGRKQTLQADTIITAMSQCGHNVNCRLQCWFSPLILKLPRCPFIESNGIRAEEQRDQLRRALITCAAEGRKQRARFRPYACRKPIIPIACC